MRKLTHAARITAQPPMTGKSLHAAQEKISQPAARTRTQSPASAMEQTRRPLHAAAASSAARTVRKDAPAKAKRPLTLAAAHTAPMEVPITHQRGPAIKLPQFQEPQSRGWGFSSKFSASPANRTKSGFQFSWGRNGSSLLAAFAIAGRAVPYLTRVAVLPAPVPRCGNDARQRTWDRW